MNKQQQVEFSRAVQAQQNGDISTALATYAKLHQSGVRSTDLLHLYGVALHQSGNHQPAIELLHEALDSAPNNVAILANLAVVYKAVNSVERCVEQYQKIIAIDPRHLEALQGLVFHLRSLRQHEQALIFAEKALAIDSKNDLTHNNVGNLYNDSGNIEKARFHYQQAVAINPKNGQAWANLASCKKYSETDRAEIDQMIDILNLDPLSNAQASELNFAIGKAHKDLNEPNVAFPYYQKHHELQPTAKFPWESFENYLAAVRDAYSRDYLNKIEPIDTNQSPVFIVGMLRAGTSLLERILASHSHFCGIGERPEIALLTQKIQGYPNIIAQIPSTIIQQLANEYSHQIAPLYDPQTQRPVDKMMTNFMHIGFIYRLFPKAKIIHARRNPYAICLSCYLQNFAQQPAWAQSLDSIGRYYSNYQQMMGYWKDNFPGSLDEVSYEDLLASPETEIRRILAFCDARWEDACLDFHKSNGVVKTASNWQVRQPLDQKNIEKWRAFEPYLSDLDKWLQD